MALRSRELSLIFTSPPTSLTPLINSATDISQTLTFPTLSISQSSLTFSHNNLTPHYSPTSPFFSLILHLLPLLLTPSASALRVCSRRTEVPVGRCLKGVAVDELVARCC
jgi:hypothetical protein